MKHIMACLLLALPLTALAQSDSLTAIDTAATAPHPLPAATVTAYGYKRAHISVPAAVNTVSRQQLGRYSNTSVLQALNATPGVRMEERSPGSYRLSIRGSALRAPFGVRNVKVYYNGIPLTDPGGFTYFNQLGYFNISSLQVIKGPAGSIYGAGTGGVLLVSSMPEEHANAASALYQMGSYGLVNVAGTLTFGEKETWNTVTYQHTASDGYRAQSAMRRDAVAWDGSTRLSRKGQLKTHFLYNSLTYQTPGALTLAEYNADARQARPATATLPGAVENRAQIAQDNFLAGFESAFDLGLGVYNTTSAYGSYTRLINPAIRNYGRNSEPHFGGRTTFRYDVPACYGLRLLAGAEAQRGWVLSRTYANNAGIPGALQSDDEVESTQLFGFAQATLTINNWLVEGGLSVNEFVTGIKQLYGTYREYNRKYPLQVSPRLALSYNFAGSSYYYLNIADGFSPPTTGELLPTGSALNLALQSEAGRNYEIGMKGTLFNRHISYDASLFYFGLTNAIALRRDSAGGDTYINAGATRQYGFEGTLAYTGWKREKHFYLSGIWASYTGYNFRYGDYTQLTTNYSGNRLPGVAPHTVAAGLDAGSPLGFYLNLTWFYSSKIPLSDANTTYAGDYHIADIKLGLKRSYKHITADIFAGVNNLLNEKYSLGNDINAAGGRYYNAAPGVNYYVGLAVGVR
ncbi:MAG: TonB-dependent receptor [Bacteroidota bacterium]